MVNWILIIVGLVFLAIFFKTKDVRHKVATFVLIALFLLLIFTIPKFTDGSGTDLNTFDGIFSASKAYLVWVKQVATNFISVTGNALKLDWTTNVSLGS